MKRQLLTLGPAQLRRTPAGRLRLSCRGCRTGQYLHSAMLDRVIATFATFAKLHEQCGPAVESR